MGKLADGLLSKKPTRNLYHYTSMQGLLGIIESKALWASKIQYMNDSAEFEDAVNVVKSAVHERRSRPLPAHEKEMLDELVSDLECRVNMHVFAASLTENGDLLSQWRGYCPDGGFAIGFSPEMLTRVLASQQFRLAPCVYDWGVKSAVVNELLDSALTALNQPEIDQGAAILTFVVEFLNIAPLFKDNGFSEEQEWRVLCGVIASDDPRFRVRAGKAMFVPYCEVKLHEPGAPLEAAELFVGPCPHMNLAMSSASHVFSSRGAKCTVVRRSMIPYRSW